jgi:hypothetical protein
MEARSGIGHRLGSASAAIALQISPTSTEPIETKATVSKNKGNDNGGNQ